MSCHFSMPHHLLVAVNHAALSSLLSFRSWRSIAGSVSARPESWPGKEEEEEDALAPELIELLGNSCSRQAVVTTTLSRDVICDVIMLVPMIFWSQYYV